MDTFTKLILEPFVDAIRTAIIIVIIIIMTSSSTSLTSQCVISPTATTFSGFLGLLIQTAFSDCHRGIRAIFSFFPLFP